MYAIRSYYEGYLLGVQSSGPYIIVGSHDPSFEVRFKGPECAAGSGFQRYAHPYHAVSETAGEFLAEIAPQGASMQRYNILSDQNDPYPRITSYNVCYTKLLRPMPSVSDGPGLITASPVFTQLKSALPGGSASTISIFGFFSFR